MIPVKLVNRQFEWMQNQYPYIKIAEYIVMPDHIHAIIEINRNFMNDHAGPGRDLALRSNIPGNPQQIKIKTITRIGWCI